MKRRKEERVGDILLRLLRAEGLETPLNEYRAVKAWPEIAGPAIARFTGDVQLRNSTLYVKITRPALRQELLMRRTQLARLINDKVGAQVLQGIVFY